MLKPLDRRLQALEAKQQRPDEPAPYASLTTEEAAALNDEDVDPQVVEAIERRHRIGDHTKLYVGISPDDWSL